MEKPKFICKYKSLSGEKAVERTVDIIRNNHIYMPTLVELNDPLEGMILPVSFATAGGSLISSVEEAPATVKELLPQIRVLSLSERGDIPQMWAHYSGNYSGICFIFSTEGAYSEIKKLDYRSSGERPEWKKPVNSLLEAKERIKENLLYKQYDWRYEREWRIIADEEDDFLKFAPSDLLAVVIGHAAFKEDSGIDVEPVIRACKEKGVPVYTTHIGVTSYKIFLCPYGFAAKCNDYLLKDQLKALDLPEFVLEWLES